MQCKISKKKTHIDLTTQWKVCSHTLTINIFGLRFSASFLSKSLPIFNFIFCATSFLNQRWHIFVCCCSKTHSIYTMDTLVEKITRLERTWRYNKFGCFRLLRSSVRKFSFHVADRCGTKFMPQMTSSHTVLIYSKSAVNFELKSG